MARNVELLLAQLLVMSDMSVCLPVPQPTALTGGALAEEEGITHRFRAPFVAVSSVNVIALSHSAHRNVAA